MPLAHSLLAEFEQESQTTRKFLERVPQDKLTWKPHEKSHSAGALALHIATVPGAVIHFTLEDQSPIPSPDQSFQQPATLQEILTAHDQGVQTVQKILPTLDDARLMTPWSALINGKPVVTMPKMMIVRIIMLNHIIHHRGQLGVYLRLTGAKVPSAYGPSGDE